MKKLSFTLFFGILCNSLFAQRITLSDLFKIYSTTIATRANTSQLNLKIKAQGANWIGPFIARTNRGSNVNWNYKINDTDLGSFNVYKDDQPIMPITMTFGFPYNVQYRDYLKDLPSILPLVNELDEDGKQTKVYENEKLVIALSIYSVSTKIFYVEGRPAPYYEIFFQSK